MAKLTFLGGARSVTGAQYLLETNSARILIDCGLTQGCHFCEGANIRPFSFDLSRLDLVIITHAHVDHVGLIPKLAKEGYRGPIYATPATIEMAKLMLDDSADLLGHEARERGEEAPYTQQDLVQTFPLFRSLDYEHKGTAKDVSFSFHEAGHVLGSGVVEIEAEGMRLAFSGDLGNPPASLLRLPEAIPNSNYVIVESAYGDRIHEDRSRRREILEDVVEDTVRRGGTLLIPAFAFERTQEILHELHDLMETRKIPRLPVFLDSPLAIRAVDIFRQFEHYFNKEAVTHTIRGDELFKFPNVSFCRTVEESKHINDILPPKIIIAGSGMMQGGRILHHARRYLPDDKSSLLILGFQAGGSLGRQLLSKAKRVRILGENVSVRCRVKAIGGYSAHADQEGLMQWVRACGKPKKVFVVQGEEAASLALRQRIRDEMGFDVMVPYRGDMVVLE
ncbi:MAG: hypothetical protein A2806_04080 [Candidatus Terrybacteria bacterium RIFCSPHIGHO2_01_FULL_48_17]|uniref:MBL fold hydrolase n=1 Tax=Candidatus Terrybacteria bacterium RIFCSPHIGHO2_01_FULL_48_17 TaxID=1802362 RepID=A0A1G2PKL0_9BACT|nr:MAG: hypothetical protein A2806_04080 [Candidatus Terrybacteria bacterium RIFCSPHIGHO2_01_FULL_48_17]OHA53747.1 MAG: hypothetical protein A3A30_05255 [Candidatus Terrybacteria bacterium RIFCSPLOWO2_01_FULL_48_14]